MYQVSTNARWLGKLISKVVKMMRVTYNSQSMMHMHRETLVKVHSRIFLALFSKESLHQSERYLDASETRDFFELGLNIDVSDSLLETSVGITSVSLEEVHRFDCFMRRAEILQPHLKLLVCAGDEPFRQMRTMLLLGCHLIISQGLGFEESFLDLKAFRSFHPMFETHFACLESVFRAVCCAKCLNWIDFSLDASECSARIQMDEYIHYAR
jgi:hypothetical protein